MKNMRKTQQIGHFFGSINWRIWRRQGKWREEIRICLDTLKNNNTSMVLGSGFRGPKGPGSRFGAGPCQKTFFIRHFFLGGGFEILNFRGSGF